MYSKLRLHRYTYCKGYFLPKQMLLTLLFPLGMQISCGELYSWCNTNSLYGNIWPWYCQSTSTAVWNQYHCSWWGWYHRCLGQQKLFTNWFQGLIFMIIIFKDYISLLYISRHKYLDKRIKSNRYYFYFLSLKSKNNVFVQIPSIFN